MKLLNSRLMVALIMALVMCCGAVSATADDYDERYDRSYYVYRKVETKGRGNLVFQSSPRGKFMSAHKFSDGDMIYVHEDWRKDGYAIAYDHGEYGYVDASYIDWKSDEYAFRIEDDKIYKGYDMNRDGVEDTFYVLEQRDEHYLAFLSIFINDKLTGEIYLVRGGWAYLFASEKSNPFLLTVYHPSSGLEMDIWKYQDGSWVNALSDGEILGNAVLTYADLGYATKDNLFIIVSAGKYQRNFFAPNDREVSFLIEYTIEDESVKLKSRYGTPIGEIKFTANRDFTTSKDEKSLVNDGPIVKKGQVVELKGLYMLKNGYFYENEYIENDDPIFEITVNGNICWVNELSLGNERGEPLFDYCEG